MDARVSAERSWTQQLILLFLLVLAAGKQLTLRRGGSRNILTGAARLRAMVGPAAMTTGGWRRASGSDEPVRPAPSVGAEVCAKTCFKRYVPKRLLGTLDPVTGRDGKW